METTPSRAHNAHTPLLDSQEDHDEVRESCTELRQRRGVDASEDDPRPPSPKPSLSQAERPVEGIT